MRTSSNTLESSEAVMHSLPDDSTKPQRVDTLTMGTDMAPALRGWVQPPAKASSSQPVQDTAKDKSVGGSDDETVNSAAVSIADSSKTTPSSTAQSSRRSSFEDRAPARLTRFTPPDNFGTVVDGEIFRSSYPKDENFSYLKALKLKSILTLVKEDCPEPYTKFMVENNIRHYRVHVPANKGGICITTEAMAHALTVVLDRRNFPLLIHCNKGKHRTGCVVACLGKVLGKNLEEIKDDYHTYAGLKARALDEQFIEQFDERSVLWLARKQGWATIEEPRLPMPSFTQSPRQAA